MAMIEQASWWLEVTVQFKKESLTLDESLTASGFVDTHD